MIRVLSLPSEDLKQREGQVQLINALGQVLQTKQVAGEFVTFETGSLSSGIYWIKVIMDNYQCDVRKIAIVR